MSRRRSRSRKSGGSTLAAIIFLIIAPIAAIKSCMFPAPKPTSSGTTYGSSYSYTSSSAYPTYQRPTTTANATRAAAPTKLPKVNIPNPNLPGHGPHLPSIHLGGHHRRHH
jgi:hypothetical protein